MNFKLKDKVFISGSQALGSLPDGNLLICTVNAHSYNIARQDVDFAEALNECDVLLPDGASIVMAANLLSGQKIERIAGWDLFVFEMQKLQLNDQLSSKKVMFLGSSEFVLDKIKKRAGVEYPDLLIHTYSPPYKPEFSDEENRAMVTEINNFQPTLLWVGMTAPKQEKWAYEIIKSDSLHLTNCHIGCIGAVFDFYAGTVERAPVRWQRNGFEWLFRLIKEPRRMWRRYLIGNMKFARYMLLELFD